MVCSYICWDDLDASFQGWWGQNDELVIVEAMSLACYRWWILVEGHESIEQDLHVEEPNYSMACGHPKKHGEHR